MRGRRRLGRALIFIGVVLWIPELWIAWVLLDTLMTPIRGPNGEPVHIQIHLNPTAWLAGIGWTLLSWGLVAWGVRILRKNPTQPPPITAKVEENFDACGMISSDLDACRWAQRQTRTVDVFTLTS